MFVAYNLTSREIVFIAPGTHIPSEYPFLNLGTTGTMSLVDNISVIGNPLAYYVETDLSLKVKKSLTISSSSPTINNDGVDQVTLTVDYKDASGRYASFVWKRPQTVGLTATAKLNKVFFISSTVGYMVGKDGATGRVYKTIDGGANWSMQSISPYELRGVFFLDAYEGAVVGDNGVIYYTNDGGTVWTNVSFGVYPNLRSVHGFFYSSSSRYLWAVGDASTILFSNDGGQTWTTQSLGLPSQSFYDVVVTSLTKAVAVGDNGNVYQTTNTGTNWNNVYTEPSSAILYSVAGIGNVYWASSSLGGVCRSIDGGINWTLTATGSARVLHSIAFADSSQGWVIGQAGTGVPWEIVPCEIWNTLDGGNTWQQQSTNLANMTDNILSVGIIPGNQKNEARICGDTGIYMNSTRREALVLFNYPSIDKYGNNYPNSPIVTVNGKATVPFTTRASETSLPIQVRVESVFDYQTNTIIPDTTITPGSVTLTVNQSAPVIPIPISYDEGNAELPPSVYGVTDAYPYLNYLYFTVQGTGNNKALEFDTSTNTLTGKEYDCLTQAPISVAIDPLGNYVYVTTNSNTYKFDRTTTALLTTIPHGRDMVRFNASGTKYYIVETTYDSVYVMDYATDTLLKTVSDSRLPIPVGAELVGDTLYIISVYGDKIGYLSTITDEYDGIISIDGTVDRLGIGLKYDGNRTIYVGAMDSTYNAFCGYVTIDTELKTMSSFKHFVRDVSDNLPADSITYKNGVAYFGTYSYPNIFAIGAKNYSYESRVPGAQYAYVVATTTTSEYIYIGTWTSSPEVFRVQWYSGNLLSYGSQVGMVGAGGADAVVFVDTVRSLNGFLTDKNMEITDNTKGLIQKSPDGTRWILSVDNTGAPTFGRICHRREND